MKTKFIALILLTTAVVTQISCEKNDDTFSDSKNIEEFNLEYLLTNKKLNEYYYLTQVRAANINFDVNRNSSIDVAYFKILIEKESLTAQEEIDLLAMLNIMGFVTLEEFNLFNQTLYDFTENAITNTNYLQLNEETRIDIMLQFFEAMNFPTRSCQSDYNSCADVAQSSHTLAVVGCTGAAIGVGAITGGPGGVIFQAFCLAAAWDAYSAELGACQNAFRNCQNNTL